jgi:AcrR family transcriptional regulator
MPKIVDHERYREELVERCITLFAARGYASLTMREIAGELSVSTGTLYHYFPSKEALFEAAVRRVTQQDLGAAAAFAALPPSPRVRLGALVAHVAENEARFGQELLVLIEFRRVNGDADAPYAGIREAADAYVAAIDAFLGLDDPALARLVLVLLNGILLQRLLDGRRTPLVEQVDTIARIFPPEPRPKAAAKKR